MTRWARLTAPAAMLLCWPIHQIALNACRADDQVEPPDLDRFPAVIRISEQTFRSAQPEIDRNSRVNTCVLGIRNVGTAQTTGDFRLNFLVADDAAQVELIVQGISVSHTVGRRRPATIYCTTTTAFDLRTLLTFHRENGFTAAPSRANVQVIDRRERVQPDAPGLRGRVIRNVARRRLQQQRSEIERISQRETRSQLTASMDQRVATRIAEWNEHWSDLRLALQQQAWYPEAPQLFFATSDDHLLAILAQNGDVDSAPSIRELRLPPNDPDSLVDVLVQADALEAGNDAESILGWIAAMPQPMLLLVGRNAVKVTTSAHAPWTAFHIKTSPNLPAAEQSSR